MIIDFHAHIFPSIKIWPPAKREYLFEMKRRTAGEAALERWKKDLDGTVEALVRDMDDAGVDRSVASATDFGYYLHQEPEISIWELNEYVAESQAKYPDRIIGFAGVDPRRKDAIELLKKAVGEWGLKGIKVLTTHYSVVDAEVQPFFATVNEMEIPALIHMGADLPPHLSCCSNPADIEVLMYRYPRMTVIAAHLARGYEDILSEVMKYSPGKVYGDLSGLQWEFAKSRWHFTLKMRYWMDKVPAGVMFGTDWPFLKTPPMPSHREFVQGIKDLRIPKPLTEMGLGMTDFTQEEKDMILGENARKLLKL